MDAQRYKRPRGADGDGRAQYAHDGSAVVGADDGSEPPARATPLARSAAENGGRSGAAAFSTGSAAALGLSTSRVCGVASHARLEALVKQTEALRRLDSDAHEAIRAELEEQIAA
jgi:hypothetical protein